MKKTPYKKAMKSKSMKSRFFIDDDNKLHCEIHFLKSCMFCPGDILEIIAKVK